MTPDFIDLHRDAIALAELIGLLVIVAFLLGNMVGYARAQHDRNRNIRLIERVADAARNGREFDAHCH